MRCSVRYSRITAGIAGLWTPNDGLTRELLLALVRTQAAALVSSPQALEELQAANA